MTSIRGRILDQIVSTLSSVSELGSVKRWDARGDQTPLLTGDVVVAGQDTRPQRAICGPVRDSMAVTIVLIQGVHDESANTTGIDNQRWQSLVKEALLADVNLASLATVSLVELGIAPEYGQGEVACGVGMVVTWDHDEDDVTTLGTLI